MEFIDKVGPYAGILGFLGTAILAFLYFSQARDVRRLREWAGRAPERAAQVYAPEAEELADVDSYPTDEDLVDEQVDEGVEEMTVPPPPPPPPTPRSLEEVQQRRVEARRRWRWLSEPRYAALLIGGVLIFGAAAVAAVVVITGGGSSSSSSSSNNSSAQQNAPIRPSDVTVAVLNGTGIPGLAQQVGGDLKSANFKVRTVTNASQQGLSRTSVLYTRGHKLEAKAVAKQLQIRSTRPADPQNASLGSGADVIVTVGSDRAPAGSSGSTGSTGTTSGTGVPATPTPAVPPTSGTPAPAGTSPPAQ